MRPLLPRISPLLLLPLLCAPGCAPPPAAVKARTLVQGGELEQAAEVVRRGLAKDPDSAHLRRLAIHIQMARSQRDQAVAAYRGGEADRGLLNYLAVYVLRWGMGHRDPAVRRAAIQGVRRADAEPLVGEMNRRLADPDELVRTWAAVAMSRTPGGADTLQEQLSSPSAEARAVAVAQVARIAGARSLAVLVKALADPAPKVVAAAIRAAGTLGEPELRSHLRPLLEHAEGAVRAAAIEALGRLKDPQALESIKAALADPYPGARVAAVEALARLLGPKARALLRPVAAGDDLPLALRAGVKLAKLGETQPLLNAVARARVRPGWTVRVAACTAAGSGAERVALDLLRPLLADPEPRVRLAAARAFASGGKAADALGPLLTLHATTCTRPSGEAGKGKVEEVTAAAGESRARLCLEAALLLARPELRDLPCPAGDQPCNKASASAPLPRGLATLQRLARGGPSPDLRGAALARAMELPGGEALAIDALKDPEPAVAMDAAAWLYSHTE